MNKSYLSSKAAFSGKTPVLALIFLLWTSFAISLSNAANDATSDPNALRQCKFSDLFLFQLKIQVYFRYFIAS